MIEYLAVVFGLLCVGLTVRQNIWCWPTGLVMVSLYIIIFFQAQLYSDMLLQVVYVFMQLYGWHLWLRKDGPEADASLSVTRLSLQGVLQWAAGAVLSALALGYWMSHNTDATFAYGDAFTTTTSLCAQWLMGKKRLESWWFWIVVDVVAIGIYAAKGLYPTAGLYAVFLGLAVAGALAWSRSAAAPTMGASSDTATPDTVTSAPA